MQLSASVNLFGVGKLDTTSVLSQQAINIDTIENNEARWIIQPKFETPILNFNHIRVNTEVGEDVAIDQITIPDNANGYGKRTAPVGMWHQFGTVPTGSNEGIFLQITDIPTSWSIIAKGATVPDVLTTGSLAELVGFSTEPTRLGELAPVKKIREAVVAVPFFDDDKKRRFFCIPRKDIQHAKNPPFHRLVGKSIIDMVEKMQRYNLPPSMDFLTYEEIEPFAMYIFEFEHELSQSDLSKIWQNVAPDISVSHDEAEATITHELLAHELLGEGARLTKSEDGLFLNEDGKSKDFNPDIRWMVFKAKFKGKTRYYENIIKRVGQDKSLLSDSTIKLSPVGDKSNVTFNWPYDYFSLVELVKLDANLEFSNIERDENTKERKVKPVESLKSMDVDLCDPTVSFRKK